MTIIKKINNKK